MHEVLADNPAECGVQSEVVRKMTGKEVQKALANAEAKPPRKNELGGDYYYKCYWIACDTDIKRWFDYCPGCGQKIDWREECDI